MLGLAQRRGEKPHVHGVRRVVHVGRGEGGRRGGCGHLRARPYKRVDLIAERLVQVGLDLFAKFCVVRHPAGKDHIAAGDKRFHVGEFQLPEQVREAIHLEATVAEVDPAEEGDVVGHAMRAITGP